MKIICVMKNHPIVVTNTTLCLYSENLKYLHIQYNNWRREGRGICSLKKVMCFKGLQGGSAHVPVTFRRDETLG